MRVPLKFSALQKLKALEVPVSAVIDVGVQSDTPELIRAYKKKHHFLIEPLAEWAPMIQKKYGKAEVKHTLLPYAISNEVGEVTLETRSLIRTDIVTHANIVDDPDPDAQTRRVRCETLDNLDSADTFGDGPHLLKIDVDGAETRILQGATAFLKKCSIVIIEVLPHNMLERVRLLDEAGFFAFDVSDLCYYGGRLAQFDMTFVNSKYLDSKAVDWANFDASKWSRFLPEEH